MNEQIKIACPNCHTKYNVSPDKLPTNKKIKLNCKKCGASFNYSADEQIEKQSQQNISEGSNLGREDNNRTMIGTIFSADKEPSPDSMPKDCNVILSYKADDKEIDKVIDKKLTIIGRTEGDIIISDPLISRKHASIEIKSPTMIELKDLASTNGTLHNGMKITSIYLQSGDIIKVGSVEIHFDSQIKFL